MPDILVATSTVADGNMYNRHDATDPDVIANRERFLKKHGLDLTRTVRVRVNYDGSDFCRYVNVDRDDSGKGVRRDDVTVADALVTRTKGLALMLFVADCIAAVIYDPVNKVLMLSHLGRHSLEQNGAQRSVRHLVDSFSSDPKTLKIWLSPAVSKENYPLWALDNKGLKEVALEQFDAAGILAKNILDNPVETDKTADYFSYSEFLHGRRDVDGDFMVIAMMPK